ncbi:MAG: DUF3732 domain-containing protein [Zoogloeaceae bacterium]|jgi:hypothetical protein|nr:DUF3732 domain-containing protein [Zoogloeaceae bacterium]
MKFQIEKLIIWPKNSALSPRTIPFHLGKVNVITGQSRTGKTAIIPIIDYCLGSDSCAIPIGVIRDTAAWYGIVIATDTERVLLARKVPVENSGTTEFFHSRGNTIEIPNSIDKANQNTDGVKKLLNTLCAVPYVQRDEAETGWNKSLSFRDLTHLVFQSQEIIANQSILFYKTHQPEHKEKLKVWMPFILGAETANMILASRELREAESELKRKQREQEKIETFSNEWLQDIKGKLAVAKEYGLYAGDISEKIDRGEALRISRIILAERPELPKTTVETLTQAQSEIAKVQEREAELSEKIAIIRKRQKDMDALWENLSGFQNGIKRKISRLGISEWLRQNRKAANQCPICGGRDHPDANSEIEKICSALQRYEQNGVFSLDLPPAVQREKDELGKALRETTEELQHLRSRFDVLRAQDTEAAKYQQQINDMFIFWGTLKTTVSLIERLADDGDLTTLIRDLKERCERLRKIVNASNVKQRLDRALQEINIATLNRLKTLDVDSDYQEVPPRFSEKELGIQILDKDGSWHWLTEVGSASNWVSFHIALTCALQEFFVAQTIPTSSVPSFMVYDQPSQVYFPKTRIKTLPNEDVPSAGETALVSPSEGVSTEHITHEDAPDEDPKYDDEDIGAVKKIFQTIATSVGESKGAWQAIVLDHAGKDIYGGIKDVVEVEEWRDGKKLIPEEWYK